MSLQTHPRLPKWPFVLGDVILVGLAVVIVTGQSKAHMDRWEVAIAFTSCALGALMSITPFLAEYRAMGRQAEAEMLAAALGKIQNLDSIAGQIASATSQWQGVQENSARTVETARQIAGKVSAEASAFAEFIQKANDNERSNLRLEVEKLRRAETEWLQVTIRLLDHVYALNQAAIRSGQRSLIDNMANFQNACREAVRRVGLVPFAPQADEPFDPRMHQAAEGADSVREDSRVGGTAATGYTYQGQMIRQALVSLQPPAASLADAPAAPAGAGAQPEEPSLF